ncbi:MAG: hypothetical protein FJX76_02095 [Armatimonadetes bacterium]|nr:hypothetical protein [Armatimonadota bacterium]
MSESTKKRRMPHAWAETCLPEEAPCWFQIARQGDWTPGRGQVAALHQDALGLRLKSETTLPRGTRIMVNVTLPTLGSLHVRGTVHGCRKQGGASHAVIRFEHLAEVDRRGLETHLKSLSTGAEQPAVPVENRRYKRYVRSMPVEYQVLGEDGVPQPARGQVVTLDIGGGGIKVRADKSLSPGDMLYLRLPLQEQPFYSLGRVAWVEPSRVQGRSLAGLQFVDLPVTERDRLLSVLSQDTRIPQ